jgi:PAS domain S-box-containing protein
MTDKPSIDTRSLFPTLPDSPECPGEAMSAAEPTTPSDGWATDQRMLSSLLSNLPGIVYRCRDDDAWTMEFLSEGVLALTGYTAVDLLGNAHVRYEDLILDDDRARIRRTVEDAVRGEQSYDIEYRIRRADGEVRIVHELGQRIPGDASAQPMLEGFITDVTVERAAAAAVQQSRRQADEYFNNANLIMEVIDRDLHLVRLNMYGRRLYGWTPEEVAGQDWLRLRLPPEAYDDVVRLFHGLFDGAPVPAEPTENAIILRNGLRRIISWHDSVLRDEAGRITAVVSSGIDITDQRSMVEALKATEERYRGMFEGSPISLREEDFSRLKTTFDELATSGVADVAGWVRSHPEAIPDLLDLVQVIDVNPASLQLYGVADKSLFLGTLRDTIPVDVYPAMIEEFAQVAQGCLSGQHDIHQELGVLSPRDLRVRWSVVPGYETTLARVIVSAIDISDSLRLQEELQRRDKLESLGTLAGGIAHDFNNILMGIMGNITLARSELADTTKAGELLGEAEGAIGQARTLTQQLLTFARGGAPVIRTENLNPILHDAISFALRGSTVTPLFGIDAGLWLVEADKGQLTQVFSNITINAVEAMPRGGTLTVKAHNCSLDGHAVDAPGLTGHFVVVAVTDQGSGIPAEHLQNIFDPFFSTKQRGSGLGLATVYSIMKKHGGHVVASSPPNAGTTITLYIPASASHGVPSTGSRSTVRRWHGRALVLDDEPMVQSVAAGMLQHLGLDVTLVSTGEQAVAAVSRSRQANEPFEVAILDLTIPGGMGGREAAVQLRLLDPHVRLVVSSGYSNDPTMAHFREDGFDSVLAKPYTLPDLARVLEALLGEPADTPVTGTANGDTTFKGIGTP